MIIKNISYDTPSFWPSAIIEENNKYFTFICCFNVSDCSISVHIQKGQTTVDKFTHDRETVSTKMSFNNIIYSIDSSYSDRKLIHDYCFGQYLEHLQTIDNFSDYYDSLLMQESL